MTIQNDLDINRGIRRVLVKHWIDLGRISIRSTKGRVLIRGRLLRIEGSKGELTTPIVEAIFAEIHKIRGVRAVTPHIDNWIKEGGRWRKFERYASRTDDKSSSSARDTLPADPESSP